MTTDHAPRVHVPDEWKRTASTEETLFDARVVSVEAHTVVFEDARLADAVRDRTGADATWRFFFASRLRLRPQSGGSKALTKLVTDRANDGFVDRLRDRGFRDAARAESRRFAVGRTEANLTRYRAAVDVDVDGNEGGENTGVGDATDDGPNEEERTTVTAEAYLAVWPDDGQFLVAGGAYPVSVDGARSAALAPSLSPERHRDELFELIRSVE
ncbi:hypothetical protein NDI76_08120 [Halogeometricum sp. S1BR25-6]|uniref:Uncharacterized protein n=1 Tax=Halogeometricum salsisoli TaxID=2950536 RepID=A0ABU2GD10_9EURY|nr:hypothetical protein [Halogeometricum sp. S1BR25-6]MDS0298706.1 hypothetical protein [Halogeometricum sp. S1BR25-6]